MARVAPLIPGAVKNLPKQRFLPPRAFLRGKEAAKLGQLRFRAAAKGVGKFSSLLMSGCQDKQVSYDAVFNNRPNGAFTFAALKTLKSLPKNATYAQWHKAVRKLLPSQEFPQDPNLYGASSHKSWKVFQ